MALYLLCGYGWSGDIQLGVRQIHQSPLTVSAYQLTPRCLLDNYHFSDLSLSGIPTNTLSYWTRMYYQHVVRRSHPPCECVSWCVTNVLASIFFAPHLVGYPLIHKSPAISSEHTIPLSASLHVFFLNRSDFCSLRLTPDTSVTTILSLVFLKTSW